LHSLKICNFAPQSYNMPETQIIEYKSAWRDEFLRWLCGFANAQGGTLVIGRDDAGKVVGVKDSEKLMEDLPNRITTVLGIVADVNLHQTPQGDYIEIVEYPKEAIREALLNAVSHKDYASGYPIQISVYSDKIMIWNEGSLPENWTIEKLLSKHPSKPYNPDIANAFFRSGYVEAWGRGIDKITEQCIDAGLPTPQFAPDGSDFWVIFRKNIYNKEDLSKLGLSERQIKAMLHTKKNGRITNSEYQTLNSVSKRTATNDLSEIVDKYKLITNIGFGAGSYYELKTEK